MQTSRRDFPRSSCSILQSMFRSLQLPDGVAGRLYLHSMPGRAEAYSDAAAEIERQRIDRVICLTDDDEVRQRSPAYARAIEHGVPWKQVAHPVPDFGIPEDAEAFQKVAGEVAEALRRGERILVHCAAGIGRTGLMAAAVLTHLGMSLSDAASAVRAAGSSAQSVEQQRFLESISRK